MGFQKDIYTHMQKLDLLMIPSLHEGLPYTLLEAMYLKVPVIASAVGGLKEVIMDGYTGILVPPADPDAIAKAIERTYLNTTLRKRLSQNAFNEVIDKFTIATMAKKYVEVYHHMLG